MKTTLFVALLIAVIPSWANNPPEPGLIACWYDQTGEFTGSTPAEAGDKAGTTIQTAASGDRAWRHTTVGNDVHSCPARLPVSSAATP